MGLLGAKPDSTPMDPSYKLNIESSISPLSNPTSFRSLIGKIIYLTHTRPDISFTVYRLSQFLSKPMDAHLHVALRIFRYIKSELAK